MNSRVAANEQHFNGLFMKIFNDSVNMISIKTLDGKIVDVNRSWLLKTGFKREEVIGKMDITIWENDNVGEGIQNLLLSGPISNLEIIFSTKEGTKRIGILNTQVLEVKSELGSIKYYVEDITDVTRQKVMEKEMCHEFRNSITSVKGFIQMLSARRELSNVTEYFDIMMEEIDRSNCLISDFLNPSKNKKVGLKKENINICITRLFPMIQAGALNENKHLKLDISALPDICMDSNEIRQLLLNLTRNAIEASPINGTITIATYHEADEVVLQIKDEGEGVEEQIINRIGTPFLTTKEGGTGMGLVICYRIAKHHNANIIIDTGSDGTSFFVRFKTQV